MKKEKILVIGGAGFVGTNLLEKLLENKDNDLTSLDCYFTGLQDNHIPGVRYIKGYSWDIIDIFKNEKFDIVYHFGEYSRISTSFDDINFISDSILRGTPKVFEFASKINAKLIYSASSTKLAHDGKDENLSPYSWMKAKMVELLKNYNKWYNLQYEICYFFNVYGPRQICTGNYATVVGIFMSQFNEGKTLTVVKPGTQSRDFTHIHDIVDGLIKSSKINLNHEWYLRSGISLTMIELAELFGKWIFVPERKGDRKESTLIINDTKEKLKWESTINLKDWIKTQINVRLKQ
jgi:UDP-glucose 4-epimerase